MKIKPSWIIALGLGLTLQAAQAAPIHVDIYDTKNNKKLGTVSFTDTQYGLLITPNLHELPPGLHGFHLHEHANCGHVGQHAGGHYDPQKTNSHLGPYQQGHLGDLPVLFVSPEGDANTPVLAPRLNTSHLKQLSVMVHAGGDNYSNNPPLGGGGNRIACGIIGKEVAPQK